MATLCASPIKGTHLRIIRLDECGVPVTGASAVVMKGFTQVQSAPQYEDGEEFLVRTADGTLCVNDFDDDLLKRIDPTVDFCSVDPDMVTAVLGARLLTSSAPVTGTGFALSEGANTAHFSVEVWQKVAGTDACAAGGVQRYIYVAWPHLSSGRLGNYTIANNVSTLQLLGKSRPASASWTAGDAWLDQAVQVGDLWLWNITTTPPPDPACGAVALA